MWYPPGVIRPRLCSLALDSLREYHSTNLHQSNATDGSHEQSRGVKRGRSPEENSTTVPAGVSVPEHPQESHLSTLDADRTALGQKFDSREDRVSTLHKICENGADTEVEFVDSDVFDRLMMLSASGLKLTDAESSALFFLFLLFLNEEKGLHT